MTKALNIRFILNKFLKAFIIFWIWIDGRMIFWFKKFVWMVLLLYRWCIVLAYQQLEDILFWISLDLYSLDTYTILDHFLQLLLYADTMICDRCMKDLFSDFVLLHCDELIILFEYQHEPKLPENTRKKELKLLSSSSSSFKNFRFTSDKKKITK